jgi:succinoglycan biosynthesis transport protein ExoP
MEGLVAQSQQPNQARIKLRTDESTAQNYRALDNSFLQRYTEALQVSQGSEARVISPAYPPEFKSKPRKSIVGSLAVFVGLGLGFGLAFFRELMDRAFRTGTHINDVVGAECVAMVPRLTATKTTTLARLKQDPADAVLRHVWCRSDAIQTIINLPLSQFAEAIRSIKLTTDLETSSKSAKVIGLISAVPGEGKSTMAMNLALAFAKVERVLLVDADMRRPSIASKLNLDLNTPGLPQLLASTANLNKCITFRDDLNLEILKTGEVPQDPLELLSPAVLSKLMNTLRKTYDRIIVDSPPMLPVSDAAVLSAHADSIVYVVKFDSTKTRQINAGLDRLHRHHGKRAGILLNKVNLRKAESYGDISYGDYYVQTESSSEKEHRVKHATAASL